VPAGSMLGVSTCLLMPLGPAREQKTRFLLWYEFCNTLQAEDSPHYVFLMIFLWFYPISLQRKHWPSLSAPSLMHVTVALLEPGVLISIPTRRIRVSTHYHLAASTSASQWVASTAEVVTRHG
jgi:hypothetical protein